MPSSDKGPKIPGPTAVDDRRFEGKASWLDERPSVSISGRPGYAPPSFRQARWVTLERFGQVALPDGAVVDGEVSTPTQSPRHQAALVAHQVLDARRSSSASRTRRSSCARSTCPGCRRRGLQQVARLPGPGLHADAGRPGHPGLPPARGVHHRRGHRMLRGLLVAAARDMVRSQPATPSQQAGLDAGHGRPHVVRGPPFARRRSTRWDRHAGRGPRRHRGPRHEHRRAPGRRPAASSASCSWAAQDVTDAVAERMGVPARAGRGAQAAARHSGDRCGARRDTRPPGSSRPPPRRSSTRSAARSTTTSRHRRLSVRRIVVSGGGSRLGNLISRLATSPDCPSKLQIRWPPCTSGTPSCRPNSSVTSSALRRCPSGWQWESPREHHQHDLYQSSSTCPG